VSSAAALAETIEVVQGRSALDRRWVPLVEACAGEFGMTVVNVTTDDVSVGGSLGRLCLWGATASDEGKLTRASGNYDSSRQARVNDLAPGGPWFVISADYEREAFRAFVEESAGPAQLEQARLLLADERIVKLNAAFGRVVIFVNTDEQRDAVTQDDRDAWEGTLWEWFSSRGTPGLARREQFRIEIDSKQNLDENFDGNSYYYWL